MGGSGKKRVQSKAEKRAQETTGREDIRAQEMHGRVQGRRKEIGDVSKPMIASGGYDPEQLSNLREMAPYGWGREGYEEFSRTGGFDPGDRERFLRSSTRGVSALYARNQDELQRRLALQGGYMPGFTTSQARLSRHAAQEGARATTDANVALEREVRTGRIEGLRGLGSTREAIGRERTGLERDVAGGRLRATRQYFSQLSDADRIDLANRLISAGVSRDEVNALLGIGGQKRSVLDTIGGVVDIGASSGEAITGGFGGG